MSTKTVSLDEKAYELLKKKKEKGESFSDVVKKLTNERSLLEIASIWEDEELRSKITDTREKTEEDLDSILEE
ncbi:MAG: antitoxin VapB family protein [Thermoplasmata archaeon]